MSNLNQKINTAVELGEGLIGGLGHIHAAKESFDFNAKYTLYWVLSESQGEYGISRIGIDSKGKGFFIYGRDWNCGDVLESLELAKEYYDACE